MIEMIKKLFNIKIILLNIIELFLYKIVQSKN
jgi:hypothetical protein